MSDTAPVQQQALPSGSRLEEFEIQQELGSGGFGITYIAYDHSAARHVVIKENLPVFAFRDSATSTVYPRSSQGEDVELFEWSLVNFEREAQTLAKFDHPNIVRLLRVFRANGTAYFVMPYVEGRSFADVLKARGRQPWTEDELRALLLPLLDALEHLHAQQVYHRDIKPGNLLIQADGRPVLIDFGAARQRLSQKSLTVVESPGYTPSEQLESRGNVGPWSDLYALAATLYKAITGEPPPKTMDRIKRDPIRCLAQDYAGQYSHDFLATIDRALSFDETDRPQSAAEWREAISTTESPPVAAKPRLSHRVQTDPATRFSRRESTALPQPAPALRRGKLTVIIFALAIFITAWAVFTRPAAQMKEVVKIEHVPVEQDSKPARPVVTPTPMPTPEPKVGPTIEPVPMPVSPPNILPPPSSLPSLTPLQRRIQESPSIGKVKEVIPDQHFLTLNVGSATNANIKEGMRFNLRRGTTIVGSVTISLMDPTESVANIDVNSVPAGITVQPGDELISIFY